MSIPSNIIIVWSGAINEIPENWFLCNGQNGTPDLRNRFVVGSGNNFVFNTTGGSADSVVVSHNHTTSSTDTNPNHSHGIFTDPNSGGAGFRGGVTFGSFQNPGTNQAGAHSHTITTNAVGESGVNKNLPPYVALAYIMYGGD
jgi:microcystin-dependent protein